ncbi:hypothetical protein DFH27DRAFT_644911 [Peziza echinospora]|nr:hypothetical protein DFH27DRAFT_644911 [Peziza echinospora]
MGPCRSMAHQGREEVWMGVAEKIARAEGYAGPQYATNRACEDPDHSFLLGVDQSRGVDPRAKTLVCVLNHLRHLPTRTVPVHVDEWIEGANVTVKIDGNALDELMALNIAEMAASRAPDNTDADEDDIGTEISKGGADAANSDEGRPWSGIFGGAERYGRVTGVSVVMTKADRERGNMKVVNVPLGPHQGRPLGYSVQHRKRPLEMDADETEGDTRRVRSREKEDVEIYFTELLKDDVTEKDMVEFLWKHYHDGTKYNYERFVPPR